MSDWDETMQRFRREAVKRGYEQTAKDVPCGRNTVYRLARGEVKKPTLALRKGVERIVEEAQEDEK